MWIRGEQSEFCLSVLDIIYSFRYNTINNKFPFLAFTINIFTDRFRGGLECSGILQVCNPVMFS